MRRDLRSSPVNGPVSPWGLYKSMMSKPLLTACAAMAVGAAAISVVHAQQVYYPPQGGTYSSAPPQYPQAYPPGGYPADYRRRPNFDALEDDDDAYPGQLPPPGPMTSPDDPRYGRPAGPPPVYTGPVLSPEDPRYARPAGAPPV